MQRILGITRLRVVQVHNSICWLLQPGQGIISKQRPVENKNVATLAINLIQKELK
jgi:hypothetical protein